MKKILVGALALVSLLLPLQASAEAVKPSTEALLHQMGQASRDLSYEMSYIWVKKNSIDTLRYRHALENGQSYAHLLFLSAPPQEVIQRGDEVSYFEPGLDPFTIKSNKMVAPILPLMKANIDRLANFYDFIAMGRAREAGVACDVVRVAPKDGNRYSYLLWIDQTTHLVMRADLLDREGDLLEQFRVVSFVVNPKVAEMLSKLDQVKLPAVVQLPQQPQKKLEWAVKWLPNGFTLIAGNRHRLLLTERAVESRMYSDGLFSFSVYVSDVDNFVGRGQLVRQGRRTLTTRVDGNKEITVVGDIPPETARRIAENVTFDNTKAEVTQTSK